MELKDRTASASEKRYTEQMQARSNSASNKYTAAQSTAVQAKEQQLKEQQKKSFIISTTVTAKASSYTAKDAASKQAKKVVVLQQPRRSWTPAPVKFNIKQYGNDTFKPFTVNQQQQQQHQSSYMNDVRKTTADYESRAGTTRLTPTTAAANLSALSTANNYPSYSSSGIPYNSNELSKSGGNKSAYIAHAGLPVRPRSSPHGTAKWKDVLDGHYTALTMTPAVSTAIYYSSDKGTSIKRGSEIRVPGSAARRNKRFDKYFEKMLRKYDGNPADVSDGGDVGTELAGNGDDYEDSGGSDQEGEGGDDVDNVSSGKKSKSPKLASSVKQTTTATTDATGNLKSRVRIEDPKEVQNRLKLLAIAKGESFSHAKFCAGTLPSTRGPFKKLMASPISYSDLDLQSNIWDISRKRRYAKGKTNLGYLVNLPSRGPGWWWKASHWPSKTWESIVGTSLSEQEEPDFASPLSSKKIDVSVLWPSQRAAMGMGLRNIETRNGLTVAGCAGEDRILQLDQSQGIDGSPTKSKLGRLLESNSPNRSSEKKMNFMQQQQLEIALSIRNSMSKIDGNGGEGNYRTT